MKPIMLIVLASFSLVFGCTQSASPPPPPVDPVLAAQYNDFADQIRRSPAQAVPALESQRKKRPGNGMDAYLLAAAHAKTRDWKNVLKELKTGNAAPYCILYVRSETPYRFFKPYVSLRELARECGSAAPTLGVDKGSELLKEIQRMAKSITRSEPRAIITVLVGIAITAIADRALVQLYTEAGRKAEAKEAARVEAVHKAWGTKFKAKVKETVADSHTITAMIASAGLTRSELDAYERDLPPTAEAKRKMDSVSKQLDEKERSLVEQMLKTMPE